MPDDLSQTNYSSVKANNHFEVACLLSRIEKSVGKPDETRMHVFVDETDKETDEIVKRKVLL